MWAQKKSSQWNEKVERRIVILINKNLMLTVKNIVSLKYSELKYKSRYIGVGSGI
jgi:hypothetical protein